MRWIRIFITSLLILLIALNVFLMCTVMAQSGNTGSVTGKVITDNSGKVPDGTRVSIYNGSDAGKYYKNTSIDKDGYYGFYNLPPGLYEVHVYGPNITDGFSTLIEVNSNERVQCDVMVRPVPCYINYTTTPVSTAFGEKTWDYNITIYDCNGHHVGGEWYITLHSDAGTFNPSDGKTDINGTIKTLFRLTVYGMEVTMDAYYLGTDNVYHKLVSLPEGGITSTPTLTASPEATATPLPTIGTISPVTTVPASSPAPTAIPAPGIELIAAMAGIAILMAVKGLRKG